MGQIFTLIIVTLFALWIYRIVKGKKQADLIGNIRGDGDYEHEVVGESFYQDALEKVMKQVDSTRICQATLVLEDDNSHDNQAVGVFIDGMKVGHLSRDDAKRFRTHVKASSRPGGAYTCNAKLFGGTHDKPSIGVWLDVYK